MADDVAKPAQKTISAPLTGFVRGGTASSAEERQRAIRAADAAERRRKQDAAYEETLRSPQNARLASMQLGNPDDNYQIVLWMKEGKNMEPREFVLCELSAEPKDDDPDDMEMILYLVCMRCLYRHHLPADECNLTIRQSNRMFTLEQKPPKWMVDRWKGPLWINPNDKSETCLVVGTIHMHERAHCARCNWTFTIDDSIVYTEN